MRSKIVWSRLASRDFENILEYLDRNWERRVSIAFIDIVNENILFIESNYKQFPVVNPKLDIRKCVLTKHNTLYYRQGNNEIHLLRIFDTRQNPNTLKFY